MRFFLFLLFVVYLFFGRWYYVCKVRNACGESITEQVQKLAVNNEGIANLTNWAPLSFAKGSFDLLDNPENDKLLSAISDRMKKNTGEQLLITGLWNEEAEKDADAGMQENIGTKRAEVIRDILAGKGVDNDRMDLENEKFVLEEGSDWNKSHLVQFLFSNLGETAEAGIAAGENPEETAEGSTGEETKPRRSKFEFNNMTFRALNFDYGSANFAPSRALSNYADSVSTYFKENEGKTLYVIGHTDNESSRSFNYKLGQRRANSVAKYFKQKGVPSNRIKTESKAFDEPVASNESEAGRAKNRRVNIQIR